LQFGLGIVLLSDISINATYRIVEQFPVLQAGLSPMNASLLQTEYFNATAIDSFWWYFPSMLTDSKVSGAVAPIACSGQPCSSFFLPGPLSVIQFDPTSPNVTNSFYPKATAFVQEDAPGYQIEYSDIIDDAPFTLPDCRVFGLDGLAIQICLKRSGMSLLAGVTIMGSNR
jgi:hypothetical protein